MHAIDTLRFSTAGSVDDGKSTLIGRLLHDAHGILSDQLAQLTAATVRHGHVPAGEAVDFSLLTDGLIAEREQGITIDVAYRFFTTEKRRFIIADTPGHEQYTRNMVTGASTADLTIVLVDAARGLTTQTYRHAVVASLLGIAHMVVAINKMDLVGYDEKIFNQLKQIVTPFLTKLGFAQISVIPMSALKGEMLVRRGDTMPWYHGPTLIDTLESTTAHFAQSASLRFPVQRVAKAKFGANADLRGLQGTLAGGQISVGEAVCVLPSGLTAKVAAIHQIDMTATETATPKLHALDVATAGSAITLVLDRQIDISRGDMLVSVDQKQNCKPKQGRAFSANLCWFAAPMLDFRKKYWIKHTTRHTRAMIEKIDYRLNVETLAHERADTLHMNDIARVVIRTQQPLVFDTYAARRETGSFVLIDDTTNQTVAGGMIIAALADEGDIA